MNREEAMQQLQAGMMALQAENLDTAENIFRNILIQDSSEIHSLHFLGVILCKKGNLDEGISLIEQSIHKEPTRFAPYLNLGRFLLEEHQLDRAICAFQEVLQKDINNFEAWSLLAKASFVSGDTDSALAAGKKAAEIQPSNADIFFSLGIYSTDKNIDEAINYYRKSISIDPKSFESWVNLGNCLLKCQWLEESISAFQKALTIKPSCFQAMMGLSRAYGDLDEWLKSLESAQNALVLDNSSHDAAFWIGYSLQKLDREQDAVNAYRAALNIPPIAAQTHLYLASALEDLGDDQNALKHYERATTINPDFHTAFTYWGALLKRCGDINLAIDKFRQVAEANPLLADAHLALGSALVENGQAEEAIESYQKAVQVKPELTDAYFTLGDLLRDRGKIDEARQVVTALQQLKPLENNTLVKLQDTTLIFDWHHRRTLELSWRVELDNAFSRINTSIPSAYLSTINRLTDHFYPPLFLTNKNSFVKTSLLHENGFQVEDQLVSQDACSELIKQFEGTESMSLELIESIQHRGIIHSILEKILLHTGLPHLIWDCNLSSKKPNSTNLSDTWHYDNHYNKWTPKLMIYLNSQRENGGATQFVSSDLSRKISEMSGYMGLVFQRQSYKNLVQNLIDRIEINPVTLDPQYYTFSPMHAGSGVWFYPSRALHRGVSPKMGVRHVLTFSLTPLHGDCGWSISQCAEKTMGILKEKIINGMQTSDMNPYWSTKEYSS